MNYRAKTIILMLGLILFGGISIHSSFDEKFEPLSVLEFRVTTSSLTPHSPIEIDTNPGFVALASSESWTGNGTEDSPYLIEGYVIESDAVCINISYVDVYFVIRNCEFRSVTTDSGVGVAMDHVQNGMIESCTFSSMPTGVYLSSSTNCTISQVLVSSGGLSISGCQGIIVEYSEVKGAHNIPYPPSGIIIHPGIGFSWS
ncbi:MAG: right-handed parallel beta-helix repeat-containing protein, partial [Candidatus Thorarchaeota archaeon]